MNIELTKQELDLLKMCVELKIVDTQKRLLETLKPAPNCFNSDIDKLRLIRMEECKALLDKLDKVKE